MEKAKFGTGALSAFVRQGSKEIAQVIPAFPSGVRVIEEPGTMGNPVPLEVYQSKHPELQTSKKDRGMEMEMG